jgi:hypothetical protein
VTSNLPKHENTSLREMYWRKNIQKAVDLSLMDKGKTSSVMGSTAFHEYTTQTHEWESH